MALRDIIEDLVEVTTTKIVVSILIGSISTYVVVDKQSNESEEGSQVAESDENLDGVLKNSKKTRKPSSLGAKDRKESVVYKPTAQITSYDESKFVVPETSDPTGYQSNSGGSNSSSYQSLFSNTPTYSPLRRVEARNDNVASDRPNTKSSERDEQVFLGAGTPSTKVDTLKDKEETTKAASSSSSSTAFSSAPIANSCSPNIVGGSFGNPVGITLACVYPSAIKYCLSTGACCDPETAGTVYTTQVVVGPQDGNYCLSYIGDSATGGSSVVYEQSYIIDSTFPNLNVSHEKTFYQTTELIGRSFISSTDFGKANFSIGQINLKSHDPGPGDLNYNCDEIIANYVTLPSPFPLEVLTLFDVSLAPLGSQVEIPLRLDQLDYGDNFITSYIENNSFVVPLYSCSTTKVNLDDFEYFQADVSQSEPGDNSVREFEGEFSSYGFFEAAIANETARAPSGENTEENTGENLKSGMYGMFY